MNRFDNLSQNITNDVLPDVFHSQMEQVIGIFTKYPDKSFSIEELIEQAGEKLRSSIYLILYKLENDQTSDVSIQSLAKTGGMMPMQYEYSLKAPRSID